MKKLLLTSACALAVAGTTFAQGSVQWTTISFADFTAVTNTSTSSYMSPGGSTALPNGTTGTTVGGAVGSFYYELLYSTTSTVAPTTPNGLSSWLDTGLEGENANVAGRAQVIASESSTHATVPFTAATSVILVGWSADLGSSWSAAEALLDAGNLPVGVSTFFGESSVGTVTPFAVGTAPGAPVFGAPGIFSTLTPLYVVATPEPTTIALGVMGGLSLLALRRKKA